MDEATMSRKDLIVMKLLHYFITEANYNPILLQGAEDEIWLENLNSDYKIIRVVSGYLHNDEQLNYDLFKTKKIASKIKHKTFSLSMNVLSIYIDLGDNVHLDKINDNKVSCVYVYDENDINDKSLLSKYFPNMANKLTFSEEGIQLYIKITEDINNKNKEKALENEDIFKKKTPYITYGLIIINALIFFVSKLLGSYDNIVNTYCLYGPFVRLGDYYRLITCGFIHGDIFHLLFNCYSLYVIGSQIESFMGKGKYIVIYFFSMFMGSLMSMLFSNYASIGASGAIFGLLGSILYFGYHYRVYLGATLKNQIIPVIVLNLLYGACVTGIDNFAHIGGLIGGVLITTSLGVKYKSTKSNIINGCIITSIFTLFMIYMAFNFVK